jgi:hypothetical protein
MNGAVSEAEAQAPPPKSSLQPLASSHSPLMACDCLMLPLRFKPFMKRELRLRLL